MREIMNNILLDMKRLCESNHAKLIVIIHPSSSDHISYLDTLSKNICSNNDVLSMDLNDKSPRDEYFLAHDGHYSAKGNQWVANCVVEYLKIHHLI